MPRQRTVRAARTRTTASGCACGEGNRPALERSAICQSTERSPSRYFTAEIVIGAINRTRKIITDFLNLRKLWRGQFMQASHAASYSAAGRFRYAVRRTAALASRPACPRNPQEHLPDLLHYRGLNGG